MNGCEKPPSFCATTVIAVRRDGKIAMASDGQVSLGQTVVKTGARKVRRLSEDRVLAGFAGASADAFTLLDRFEGKMKEYRHSLFRAAVELAKEWRTDRYLRRLEAMLIVADAQSMLLVSGTGDVIRQSGSYTGTVITGTVVHDCGDECIQLANCTNCFMENVTAYNAVQDGLNFANSRNSTIRNCEIYDSRSENGAIFVYENNGITIENTSPKEGDSYTDYFGVGANMLSAGFYFYFN